jgi:hypothetical protein
VSDGSVASYRNSAVTMYFEMSLFGGPLEMHHIIDESQTPDGSPRHWARCAFTARLRSFGRVEGSQRGTRIVATGVRFPDALRCGARAPRTPREPTPSYDARRQSKLSGAWQQPGSCVLPV